MFCQWSESLSLVTQEHDKQEAVEETGITWKKNIKTALTFKLRGIEWFQDTLGHGNFLLPDGIRKIRNTRKLSCFHKIIFFLENDKKKHLKTSSNRNCFNILKIEFQLIYKKWSPNWSVYLNFIVKTINKESLTVPAHPVKLWKADLKHEFFSIVIYS